MEKNSLLGEPNYRTVHYSRIKEFKPLSNRKNGKQAGNNVSVQFLANNLPIAGRSVHDPNRFQVKLNKNIGANNRYATVVNRDGQQFRIPINRINYFRDKELQPYQNVTLRLSDGREVEGALNKFNGETFVFQNRKAFRGNNSGGKAPDDVDAREVTSFSVDKNNLKREAARQQNERILAEELRSYNYIGEKHARALFTKALKEYFRVTRNKQEYLQSIESPSPYNTTMDEGIYGRIHEQLNLRVTYLYAVMKKLLDRFPRFAELLPPGFVGHLDVILPGSNNSPNGLTASNYFFGRQKIRKRARPTNASGMTGTNVGGSSNKPIVTSKTRKINKLPYNASKLNTQLIHVVTGPPSMRPRKMQQGDVLHFNGETYWHGDEFWSWPGKGSAVALYKLVGNLRQDKKLTYTGRHSRETKGGAVKGTYRHEGPLNVYVYDIGHDGRLPVYYVRQLPSGR